MKEAISEVVDLEKESPLFIYNMWPIRSHIGHGKAALIELKDDQLYIDGKKVLLLSSPRQRGDYYMIDLEQDLKSNKDVIFLNNTLAKFLEWKPEFFPEHWKEKDENGLERIILFWGTMHTNSVNKPCVSAVQFHDEKVLSGIVWTALRSQGLGGYVAAAIEK